MKKLTASVFFAFSLLIGSSASAQTVGIGDLPVDSSIGGGELTYCTEVGVASRSCTLAAIKSYVGATGVGLPNDITAAPYNATCNGSADDSTAFELAVDTGGIFYIPPGSRCVLSSTSSHAWGTSTFFYGLAGAEEDTHIDIGAGLNFVLTGGAFGLANLTIKDGGHFISTFGLNASVSQVRCVNVIWDNVESLCIRSTGFSENANAVINRVYIVDNKYINPGSDDRGLALREPDMFDVQILNNYMSGGNFGMRIGEIQNTDALPENDQRRRYVISGNIIENIEGGGETSQTVGCFAVFGINVVIANNVCENITDSTSADDTECIYSKARNMIVTGNTLMNCGNEFGGMRLISAGSGHPTTGCTVGSCGNRSIVSNNIIVLTDTPSGNYRCLLTEMFNVIISNNIFSGCTYRGIETQFLADATDMIITGNIFENMRSIIGVSIVGDYDNVIISDNIFASYVGADVTEYTAIEIETEATDTITNVQIIGNLFSFTDQGDTTTGIHIDDDNVITDIMILNNMFGDQDVGIRIDGSGTLNNLTIGGNNFAKAGDEYLASGVTFTNCIQYNNRNISNVPWTGQGACL